MSPKGTPRLPVMEGRCRQCDRRFLWQPKSENDIGPAVCGRVPCAARQHWNDEQWAGRARMARARLNAHGPDALDDLDREALTRTDPTWSTP